MMIVILFTIFLFDAIAAGAMLAHGVSFVGALATVALLNLVAGAVFMVAMAVFGSDKGDEHYDVEDRG